MKQGDRVRMTEAADVLTEEELADIEAHLGAHRIHSDDANRLIATARSRDAQIRHLRTITQVAREYVRAWYAFDEAGAELERATGGRGADGSADRERLNDLGLKRRAAHDALLRAVGPLLGVVSRDDLP